MDRWCKFDNYALLLVLTFLLTPGCSRNNGRQEVSGTVTIDGTPVTMGLVNFQPVDTANAQGSGATLRDGGFQLPAAKGLLPGKYVATVQAFKETGKMLNDPMMGKVPQIVPVQLAGAPSIEATIVSGGPNRFDFHLNSVNAAKHY
jgi:hypothetical protein